jgi:hypothetical protein
MTQPHYIDRTCQKCGGEIQGWTCQGCGQVFRENDAGALVFAPIEAGTSLQKMQRTPPAMEAVAWRADLIGVYEAICEWIRNDVGLSVQMSLTPDATKKLVSRIQALAVIPTQGPGT